MSPHNLLVICLVLLFRVHLGTFVLATLGFKVFGFALESQLEAFGLHLLQSPSLEAFWTGLYNTQIGRLSFFNYTTTMGGLFISLIASIPLWIATVFLIKQYRTHIMSWIEKNKLLRILKSSALIRLYNNTSGGQ